MNEYLPENKGLYAHLVGVVGIFYLAQSTYKSLAGMSAQKTKRRTGQHLPQPILG